MNTSPALPVSDQHHAASRRASYVIDGGTRGRDRLRVLSSALDATTRAVLERAGLSDATDILDLGCGGGDVAVAMATMAPHARVTGADFDPDVIVLASDEARRLGIENVRYVVADVAELTSEPESYDIVYARFLLSHLANPDVVLARIRTWIRPGGALVIEDVDIDGAVCFPASPAFDAVNDLLARAMRRRGGDPDIGRKLPVLLRNAGFDAIATTVVQPGGLAGDAKQIQLLTLNTIEAALRELHLATSRQIDQVRTELEAFVERPDTYVTTARIFQAVARPHVGAHEGDAVFTRRFGMPVVPTVRRSTLELPERITE